MTGALKRAVLGGALVFACCPAGSVSAAIGDAPDGAAASRYEMANGCFAVRSVATERYLRGASGSGSYTADRRSLSAAEPFFMKPTDLGEYMLYASNRRHLAVKSDPPHANPEAASSPNPGPHADWRMAKVGPGEFTLRSRNSGRNLSVDPATGDLRLADAGRQGARERFNFVKTDDCTRFPEVRLSLSGKPLRGTSLDGPVAGFVDAHMHHMAFEFLGGRAHCGQPWNRYGVTEALVDCPDHEIGDGCGAILENVLFGNPARCHDPTGWPTFKDWPHHQSLTHENSYYRWLERAWRGGLRIFVNLLVENRVLCEIYPLKKNSCNEMDSVLLQARRMRELQDYIDAQSGGPGKGWFRMVTNPVQARRVINRGKLAIVTGMEVSEPFGCRLQNEEPQCNRRQIDSWLERLHELGVRQLEIVNKFDNALTGVAGDSGTTGTVVNLGNFYGTGSFWDLRHCNDPENHDNSPAGATLHNDDLIIRNGIQAIGGPPLPVYPEPPHCNRRGLSALGEHAIREIAGKGMTFDPDHMSWKARNQALDLVESLEYPGIISSHSWSTPDAVPRIYELGGFITPYAGSSEGFVDKWRRLRQDFTGERFSLGYGADMNGFGSQGGPRNPTNPVQYPFKSFDGGTTINRQRSGRRVFDINTDGVAHYGLYPDWVEDLRMIAGDRIVRDLSRGAEGYLETWESAVAYGRARE